MTFVTNIFKKYLLKIWFDSAEQNHAILISHIEPVKYAKVLDIGCDNGKLVIERLKNITNPEIYGIDLRKEAVLSSRKLGIKAVLGDVEMGLPFRSSFFDVVFANQIIEHLLDVDFFINEVNRVLKPKGYLILSTENLSSWHNIFALILGWQAFSQSLSKVKHIGNPLKLTKYENINPSGMHIKIFTLKGLKELFEIHGFEIQNTFGAGYYPFPLSIAQLLSIIDSTHSAFIGIKARKIAISKKVLKRKLLCGKNKK